MAFVVEDGTGLANATAYVAVADLDAYWTEQGVDLSSYTDPQKQGAIRNATVWVDSFRFRGVIKDLDQALLWPRQSVYDDEARHYAENAVPQRVKDAVCEVARHQLEAEDDEKLRATRADRVRREKAGPVEREFFDDRGTNEPDYAYAESLLRPLFVEAGQSISVGLVRV